MLLRFAVANHLSIRDSQEISFVPSSLKDVEDGLIDTPIDAAPKLLPATVIYGANASGKSNIVSGLRYLKTAIIFSHSRGDPRGGTQRTPFALDPTCKLRPSTFNIDFLVDGVRHYYGFQVTNEVFDAEWLYAFPENRRQTLFTREDQRFDFGRSLKGRNKIISDLTRPNSLFLSAAAQNDHEYISKVVSFFKSIRFDNVISIPGRAAAIRLGAAELDSRVITFLRQIGTGVVDYRRRRVNLVERRNIASSSYAHQDFLFANNEASDLNSREERGEIQLGHQGRDGEAYFLDLSDESAGTRRLLLLLIRVFRALDTGGVLVVDELDASLHTQACEAIIAQFSNKERNPRGAQILATTHDTNLLSSNFLRRDQIWFTEKNSEGATHLYPLTDIRTRRGDNIERGYLQGRYGAIPFSGSASELLSEK